MLLASLLCVVSCVQGLLPEQVQGADGLTVRVINNVIKKCEVGSLTLGSHMLKTYTHDNSCSFQIQPACVSTTLPLAGASHTVH
jgi:hypothetical protein